MLYCIYPCALCFMSDFLVECLSLMISSVHREAPEILYDGIIRWHLFSSGTCKRSWFLRGLAKKLSWFFKDLIILRQITECDAHALKWNYAFHFSFIVSKWLILSSYSEGAKRKSNILIHSCIFFVVNLRNWSKEKI